MNDSDNNNNTGNKAGFAEAPPQAEWRRSHQLIFAKPFFKPCQASKLSNL
jgi:hypothetical protein